MRRPIGIVILALIQAFVGVVLLIGGVTLLIGNNSTITQQALSMSMSNLPANSGAYGVVILLVAAIELVIAYGLFQLKGWAWALSLVLFGANVVMTAIDLINRQTLTQTQIASGLVGLLIVLYLLLPGVRSAFFSQASAHAV